MPALRSFRSEQTKQDAHAFSVVGIFFFFFSGARSGDDITFISFLFFALFFFFFSFYLSFFFSSSSSALKTVFGGDHKDEKVFLSLSTFVSLLPFLAADHRPVPLSAASHFICLLIAPFTRTDERRSSRLLRVIFVSVNLYTTTAAASRLRI